MAIGESFANVYGAISRNQLGRRELDLRERAQTIQDQIGGLQIQQMQHDIGRLPALDQATDLLNKLQAMKEQVQITGATLQNKRTKFEGQQAAALAPAQQIAAIATAGQAAADADTALKTSKILDPIINFLGQQKDKLKGSFADAQTATDKLQSALESFRPGFTMDSKTRAAVTDSFLQGSQQGAAVSDIGKFLGKRLIDRFDASSGGAQLTPAEAAATGPGSLQSLASQITSAYAAQQGGVAPGGPAPLLPSSIDARELSSGLGIPIEAVTGMGQQQQLQAALQALAQPGFAENVRAQREKRRSEVYGRHRR